MKRTLSAVMIMLALSIVPARAAIYYWNGAAGDSLWTNANNWNPVRTTPAAGDTISFNNADDDTVIGVPTETISALLVGINTRVYMRTTSGTRKTLTVGNYLSVNSGCQLNLYGPADSMTIFVGAGGVGQVSGSMNFSGMAQKLNANDVNAIQFNPGASFTQNCGGNVFSALGTSNVVVFNTGSEFIQYAGSNPFGLGQPASKVQFLAGSWFRCRMTNSPAFSGRSYANFELDYPTFSATAIGGNPTSIDTLKITDGKLILSLSRITIKGDILIAAAETLQFRQAVGGGATICSLKFYGTAPQTIGSGGTLLFMNDSSSVYVDNAAGLTIDRAFQVRANLALFNGIVTANDTLKMMSDQTIQRTNGYIVGPLAMHVATGATLKTFPVGTANGYSPVAVVPSGITAAGYLTCRAVQTTHPDAAVQANTMQRYWTILNDGVALDSYQMAFWYLPGDFNSGFTEAGDESTMVVGKYDAAAWSFPSILGRDTAANYIEVFGNTFSDFTLGKNAAAFLAPDTTHPAIIGTVPANNAINVPIDQQIVIAFSEPIDTTTFVGTVTPFVNGLHQSWNATHDALTLAQTVEQFSYNTIYTVKVTAAKDMAGNDLAVLPDSILFTTVANLSPMITVVQLPQDTYDAPQTLIAKALITDPAKAGITSAQLSYAFTGSGAWYMVAGTRIGATDTFQFDFSNSYSPGTVIDYCFLAYDDQNAETREPAGYYHNYRVRVLSPIAPTNLRATTVPGAAVDSLFWTAPAESLWYNNPGGSVYYYPLGAVLTTRFTPMYDNCKLERITSLWETAGYDSVRVHVYADDGTGLPDTATELVTPFKIKVNSYPNYTNVDLSGQPVYPGGDFHVGYEYLADHAPFAVVYTNPQTPARSLWDSAGTWVKTIGGGGWTSAAVVSYSSYAKKGAKNVGGYEVWKEDGSWSLLTTTPNLGYEDNAVVVGNTYQYNVRALYPRPSLSDTFSYYTGPVSITTTVSGEPALGVYSFFLLPASPNPVRGSAAIQFSIAKPGKVSIVVYNVAGQKVKTLVNASLKAGQHSVNWNGRNEVGQKVAAGMYMYRMVSGDYSATRKLVVIR